MAKKQETSNLFADYDLLGTEANIEVVKTSIKKNSIKDVKKEEAIKDMQNAGVLLNEINNKEKSDKLNILANKIQAAKQEAEKAKDKKSYSTYYLKNSSKNKIDNFAKKLNVSKSEALDILIDNFEN